MAGVGGKRQAQAVVPITGAVAAVGNRVNNGQYVKDYDDNHDHKHKYIKEVLHSNNGHHEFPAIPGRLEQPVNRR